MVIPCPWPDVPTLTLSLYPRISRLLVQSNPKPSFLGFENAGAKVETRLKPEARRGHRDHRDIGQIVCKGRGYRETRYRSPIYSRSNSNHLAFPQILTVPSAQAVTTCCSVGWCAVQRIAWSCAR